MHTTISTRQSRKGEISSWKAFAPAHPGKLAIEAVARCLRGEGAPSPIYEGEDSVLAYVFSGPKKKSIVPLPIVNEQKKANLLPKNLSTRAVYTQITKNENAVPEVRGMSVLQAKVVLRQFGYQTKVNGSGQVNWQSPKPGTILAAGSRCTIGLQ